MIYTVTLNPALDYNMHLTALTEGITNRSNAEELCFGGKGINLSTVLSRLKVKTTAFAFIAGFTGDALERAVRKEGIKTKFFRLKTGLTRINVKLKGAAETEINAAGPIIDEEALERLFKALGGLNSADTLVLAGSVPSCLSKDIYAQIAEKVSKKGVRLVVDATGELLLKVLKYRPFLIKPNLQELQELAGRTLTGEEDIIAAARELKDKGAKNVLVTLGGDGALLLTEDSGIYRRKAPSITPVNTVGAGDSMIAGFLAGISKGCEYALTLGTAAGAATASLPGLATRQRIFEIMDEIN